MTQKSITHVLFGGLCAAALLLSAACARAADVVISYAEQPVQLIRAATLYTVAAGTVLRPGDIVQSGTAGLQIEGLPALTLALGPDSKLYLGRGSAAGDLSLLSGWLKVQPAARAAGPAMRLSAGMLRFDAVAATSVLHVDADQVAVFVESGQQAVTELDKRGQAARQLALAREQYVLRRADQPLQQAGRPDKAFVASMPRQFFDALVPVANKRVASAPALKKEREVSYEDVAPWLLGPASLDKNALAASFAPRLADARFRQQVSDELGGAPEWRAFLDNQKTKKSTLNNVLF